MDSPAPTLWSPGASVVKTTQSAVFANDETSCVVASQPSSVTVEAPCGDSVASSGRRMPSAVPNVYAWSPASVSVVPPETPSAKRTGSVAVTEAAPSRTSGFGTVPVPTASVAPSQSESVAAPSAVGAFSASVPESRRNVVPAAAEESFASSVPAPA